MNCPECGQVECMGSVCGTCGNLCFPPTEPDIYDAVSHFRMNTKPAKPEIGHMYRHGYDGPFRIWNGMTFQQVNPTPQESIDKLVEQYREQYRRGFTDGVKAVRQAIAGELTEVREYLLTLTDDDTSYAKRERMLNAIIQNNP